MKYFTRLFTFLAFLFLVSCSQQEANKDYPQDLAGKRALLKEKQEALKEITVQIARLEQEIDSLDPSANSEMRRLVTAAQVQRVDFKHFVEIQGSVQADDFVGVASEASGRILQLKVDEGDNVRKGQLIAELDLEQLQKQVDEVQKSLELATSLYERQKRLWDQNIGSEVQYLEAKNGKERLEKSLETLRFQQSKSKVYAPVAGVVEQVVLQAGELASPGMPIIQILNPNKLKVVANVPENYLRAVKMGEKARVSFPALGQEQDARISLIGRTIDPANRTFNVEASVSNPNNLLKPNLLAVMLIMDFEQENVVSIPLDVVQQEVSGKDYVFVKESGERGPIARKVYVKTGRNYDGQIVIEEGLKGGEELILEGARGLAENDPIEIDGQKG
ncbi:MAG: efflux RND transporter periplasmic adaptor subunit [Phaeodactylibacter sp.]|nr:efflux RND transporter periplasmic adaptor subunit [Phaeodactylibacter sp.]MCB9275398.1 efflux RND transporter periplasmic adaptor subunit [Lewinellaceae bacterium]